MKAIRTNVAEDLSFSFEEISKQHLPSYDIFQYRTFPGWLSSDDDNLWEWQSQFGIGSGEDVLQLIDHWNQHFHV